MELLGFMILIVAESSGLAPSTFAGSCCRNVRSHTSRSGKYCTHYETLLLLDASTIIVNRHWLLHGQTGRLYKALTPIETACRKLWFSLSFFAACQSTS